jgi:hypothetical protein
MAAPVASGAQGDNFRDGFSAAEYGQRRGVYQVKPSDIRCVRFPCPTWTIFSFDRPPVDVVHVDFSLLKRSVGWEEAIAAGEVLVHGHFAVRDPKELVLEEYVGAYTVFRVEEVVGDTERVFHLMDSGIRCIVAPCPMWLAMTIEGREVLFTDLDLTPLGLERGESTTLFYELMQGRWIVDGQEVRSADPNPFAHRQILQIEALVDRYDPVPEK